MSESLYYPWLSVWFAPRKTAENFPKQSRFWLKAILVPLFLGIITTLSMTDWHGEFPGWGYYAWVKTT